MTPNIPNELHDGIRAFVNDFENGWKSRDAAAMFQRANETAGWINIIGMYWKGKANVVAAHQAYLDTFLGGVDIDLVRIERVDMLSDSSWLAVVRWQLGDIVLPTGEVRPACDNLMTLVFIHDHSGLRFEHGANIEVIEALAAANPISDEIALDGAKP